MAQGGKGQHGGGRGVGPLGGVGPHVHRRRPARELQLKATHTPYHVHKTNKQTTQSKLKEAHDAIYKEKVRFPDQHWKYYIYGRLIYRPIKH